MLKKETELKALLSKQEYQELMNLLVSNSCSTTEQMNYYFDTPNEELRSKNVTCRIRQKEDKLIGTKKSHFYKPNEVYSIEENFPVSEFCTCLYIDNKKLELKGELFTKRITIPWGTVGHLALDLNMYLGTVDYELEFEYLPCFEEIAVQTFSSILALFGDSKQEFISISKSERFFQRLLQLQGNPNTDAPDPDDYLSAWFPNSNGMKG